MERKEGEKRERGRERGKEGLACVIMVVHVNCDPSSYWQLLIHQNILHQQIVT